MRSKSIIILLLVSVLISESLAAWVIPLKSEEVYNTIPKGKFPDDIIFTREILYGSDRVDKPQPTVFDTTSKFNWVISTECPRDTTCFNEQDPNFPQPAKYECLSPCKIFTDLPNIKKMPVFGGRITFDESKTSFDNIRIQEGDTVKTFTGIQSFLPISINKNSEQYLIKKPVRSSLGLGATDVNYNSSSFLNTVQQTVKTESNRFSFYFHKDLNQLRFGKEEGFYKSGPFSVFKNRAKFNANPQTDYTPNPANPLPDNKWSLTITRITFNKPATDIPFNTDATTHTILPDAVFDSTTNFFWGDSSLISRIASTLEGLTPSKCQVDPATGIYDCECTKDASEYPPIYFTFENQTREFALSGKDYIHIYKEQYEPGLRNCILLFRTALKYDTAAASAVPITNNKIFFPTSFLKAHYTVFDQTDNTISIAPAFQVQTQKAVLNATDRYIFITLSSLAFIATIIALLSLIPKIPYVQPTVQQQIPPTVTSTTTFVPVQQPQQIFVQQTPPKITQNYILSSLPIQAQPATTIQQSPIRQSYTRPYQGYITGNY